VTCRGHPVRRPGLVTLHETGKDCAERGLGLTPAQALAELTSIKRFFPFLADTPAIYGEWEKLIVQHSVLGKNGHDTRYVAAMNIHGITHFLTDNKDDFKRFTNITVLSTSDI
jgi:hypothetical protein